MKIKQTARGYETTAAIPIVHGVPTWTPTEDGTAETDVVYDDVGKTLCVFDFATSAWIIIG